MWLAMPQDLDLFSYGSYTVVPNASDTQTQTTTKKVSCEVIRFACSIYCLQKSDTAPADPTLILFVVQFSLGPVDKLDLLAFFVRACFVYTSKCSCAGQARSECSCGGDVWSECSCGGDVQSECYCGGAHTSSQPHAWCLEYINRASLMQSSW